MKTSPDPGALLASVVVCTYNRAELLTSCLESLAAQTLPASQWELIIVDDGSTDHTPAVCAQFAGLGNLRVCRESNSGLGAARNRGWRAASAPIVAFLDDDATAPPDWLARGIAHFSTSGSTALGGPVLANWESPPPRWLDERLAVWLTVWKPFSERRESSDGLLFVGANMFLRRDALESAGGFDDSLGRKRAQLLSHEESDLWDRLRLAGHHATYDPDLWVKHFIPSARMTPAWFRRRLAWEGVSVARRERKDPNPRPMAALWMSFTAFFARPVLGHLLHPSRWGRSIAWQCHLAYKWGYALELARRNR